MTEEQIISAVERWMDKTVVGLNLCPFARAPLARGAVRLCITRADTEEVLLRELAAELHRLEQQPGERKQDHHQRQRDAHPARETDLASEVGLHVGEEQHVGWRADRGREASDRRRVGDTEQKAQREVSQRGRGVADGLRGRGAVRIRIVSLDRGSRTGPLGRVPLAGEPTQRYHRHAVRQRRERGR